MKTGIKVLLLIFTTMHMFNLRIFSQDCLVPGRVEVLPVFFVPKNGTQPTQAQKDKLIRHLRWSQTRYKEMMKFRSTFSIADTIPHVYAGTKNDAFYKSQSDGGASQYVHELLTHYGYSRFNCPYVFVVLYMSPQTLFPVGGGRPINAGFNTGGGVVILSSYELDKTPNFQSTLQHELGHSFGLPHVNVYGYDMNTNQSIMSYNLSHHTNNFNPSPTPGILIPENLRDLSLNKLVFPDMFFNPAEDIPANYALHNKLVYLGILDIPDHASYTLRVKTNSGETFGSRVGNIVQHEIKPSLPGSGTNFDANNMWHSGIVTWAEAEVRFPFPVTLDKIGLHTQHSGLYHPADSVKIEVYNNGNYRSLLTADMTKADEYVSFQPATDSVWRFSFRTGTSGYVVVRGLEFFNKEETVFPPLVPYAYQNPFADLLPSRPVLISPEDNFTLTNDEINFEWSGNQANNFMIQIDTTKNFCQPIVDAVVSDNTFMYTTLPGDNMYYWRVKGLNNTGHGFSQWSETRDFQSVTNSSTDPSDMHPFSIFPNPASEYILIQYVNENIPSGTVLRILNAYGQLVFEKSGLGTTEMVMTDQFRSGMYFVEYISAARKYTGKFTVVH